MNQEIRKAIREADLFQWQVAAECGVTEYTLIRWLRTPLSKEHREAILGAIERLSGKGA